VASLGSILRRFRFHGVPGAAGFGVPVDREAQLDTELLPVLALLDAEQRHASALVVEAEREARVRTDAAEVEAQMIVAEACAQADAARAEAVARILEDAARECVYMIAAAQVEIERIALVAADRTPRLAAEIVQQTLGLSASPR
jgi:vacuolar-type H+-ATPase subunit H